MVLIPVINIPIWFAFLHACQPEYNQKICAIRLKMSPIWGLLKDVNKNPNMVRVGRRNWVSVLNRPSTKVTVARQHC